MRGSRWVIVLALVGGVAGCGEDTNRPAGLADLFGAGGVAGSSAGGAAGESGAAGVGIGGSLTDAAVDAAPEAGEDAPAEASGAAGWGGYPTPELPCVTNAAFGAQAISFSPPTPDALWTALNEVSSTGSAITLVVYDDGTQMVGAVSATQVGDGASGVFPASEVPCLLALVPEYDDTTFTTQGPPGANQDPQPRAFLHLVDQAGPVVLTLEHVRWYATASPQCASVSVTVDAVVPSDALSLVLHLAGGEQSIAELSGTSGGPLPTVHFTFTGVETPFDFSTLNGTHACGEQAASDGGSEP